MRPLSAVLRTVVPGYDALVGSRTAWNVRWALPWFRPCWMHEEPRRSLRHAIDEGWLAPGMRILELGCGEGHGAAWLSGRGLSVHAVDFSPTAISRSRRRHPENDRLRFQEADIRAPEPGIAGVFDAVVDSGCLNSIEPTLRRPAADNIRRWLPPGGRLLLALHLTGVSPEARRAMVRELFLEDFRLEGEELLDIVPLDGPTHRNLHVLLRRR